MFVCSALCWEAFTDWQHVLKVALVRADQLGLSLIDKQTLWDCLAAFLVPPVCARSSGHGWQGSLSLSRVGSHCAASPVDLRVGRVAALGIKG